MKKLIVIFFCITCFAANALKAQTSVRVGNLEFSVRKNDQDTIVQITVLDTPQPAPPVEQPASQPIVSAPRQKFDSYSRSYCLIGGAFALPDNRYLTTLGGSSYSLDFGRIRRQQLTRNFAVGGTYKYSFYNYRLRNAAHEEKFRYVVTGDNEMFSDVEKIDKEAFRSHNLAIGIFARLYLIAPRHRRNNDGVFIDIGAQGDYAFNRFYRAATAENKRKFSDDQEYFSKPFYASAVARLGGLWLWDTRNSPSIYVKYRFTEALKQNVLPVDLPPISIGMHFYM